MAYVNCKSIENISSKLDTEPKVYATIQSADEETVQYSTIDNNMGLDAVDDKPGEHDISSDVEHNQVKTTTRYLRPVVQQSCNLKHIEHTPEKPKYKSIMSYIVLLICMIVIAGVSSTITAVILKQNLEDSWKRVRVDNWSQWSDWGDCSVTCNVGVRERNRTCNGIVEDEPLGICSGNGFDMSTCSNMDCTHGHEDEFGPSDVSFSSYLNNSLTNVRLGTTVVFNRVINNDGNAYNSSTGVFTCPTAGKYLFSLTVHAFNYKTAALKIIVNGISRAITVSEPAKSGHDSTGTAVLVYPLNIDQRVWVETYDIDNTDLYSGFTQFVGVLIHR